MPLITEWLAVWNGDYARADAILTPDFRVHAAMLDGTDGSRVRGPAGLTGWVAQTRAAFPDLTFSIEVGPLTDGDLGSARWIATGTYAGGFPGATAAPGTRITFTGTDTLRVENGKYAEYWVNSDMHVLLAALGVGA